MPTLNLVRHMINVKKFENHATGEADPDQLCNNTVLNNNPTFGSDIVAAEHPIVMSKTQTLSRRSLTPHYNVNKKPTKVEEDADDFELVPIDADTQLF